MANHWYSSTDGKPVFEVPKKKGGGMRAVNIKDAREMKLVPSVTTILGTIGKQGLQNWIVEQHLKAAYECPPLVESARIQEIADVKHTTDGVKLHETIHEYEKFDDWKKRVKIKADEERLKAAGFGTRFHDGVEAYLTKKPIDPEVLPWVDQVQNWEQNNLVFDSQVSRSEFHIKPFGGYGGRADRLDLDKDGNLTLIDFKSQNMKKKFNFYPSFGAQLAAYMCSIKIELRWIDKPVRLVSFVIDSKDPTQFEIKDWDYLDCFDLFKAGFKWWRAESGW